jgi:hypothetical protein
MDRGLRFKLNNVMCNKIIACILTLFILNSNIHAQTYVHVQFGGYGTYQYRQPCYGYNGAVSRMYNQYNYVVDRMYNQYNCAVDRMYGHPQYQYPNYYRSNNYYPPRNDYYTQSNYPERRIYNSTRYPIPNQNRTYIRR